MLTPNCWPRARRERNRSQDRRWDPKDLTNHTVAEIERLLTASDTRGNGQERWVRA
jgi:hypothetical protein